jgi:hypothetical protein
LEAVFGVLGESEDVVGELWWGASGVGHGLDTASNTDFDSASENAVSDVLDGLETRRAEAVYGVGWSSVWDTSSEGSSTDLVSSIGLDNVSKDHIIDEGWVNLGLFEGVFDDIEDELIWKGIFESTTAGLGERSTDGSGNDNVVGVLGGNGGDTGGALEVGKNGVETVRHVGDGGLKWR